MYMYKLLIGVLGKISLFYPKKKKKKKLALKAAAYKVCQNFQTNPRMIKFLEKKISKPDTFISAYFF